MTTVHLTIKNKDGVVIKQSKIESSDRDAMYDGYHTVIEYISERISTN
jgi:hypothetical protein